MTKNLILKSLASLALGATMAVGASGVAQAAPADNPLPLTSVASPQENQAAQAAFNTQLGTATAIGGFAGTVTGAVIGAGVGTFVLPAVGTLVGLTTGAGVGGILGTIAAGGPTLVVAGDELLKTFNAAPGTTKWAQ